MNIIWRCSNETNITENYSFWRRHALIEECGDPLEPDFSWRSYEEYAASVRKQLFG